MNVSIREFLEEDAEPIFALRNDPRLRQMQYRPSRAETPQLLTACVHTGDELPDFGLKCSTVLVDESFAGHIFQNHWTRLDGILAIELGWNLLPELWGHGIMAQALTLLFDTRFQSRDDIVFNASCFQSNVRCQRVIDKLGFEYIRLTLFERFSHFTKTWGRQRVMKHQLTYNHWQTNKQKRDSQSAIPSGTR